MPINLHLYSTSHCHLCEQAETLLKTISKSFDITWLIIEIADDKTLLEHYEVKIPVLKRLDTSCEIYWPFNHKDIEIFLST